MESNHGVKNGRGLLRTGAEDTGCVPEHNFGHGEQHLATVFACLMMLAFGIDQLQKACCPLFRAAQARKGRAKYFWEDFRSMFTTFRLPDWDTFYRALAFGHEAPVPVPFDSS